MTYRVLVIDDTVGIHEDIRKILLRSDPGSDALNSDEALLFGAPARETGSIAFEIDSAMQGQAGFEMMRQALLAQRPYALAFVDVRMPPGWDGIETITRLWELYPELQVVICTAYSDYSWADITERFGHSDSMLVLKKPFDPLAVLQMAHALVKKWSLAQQSKSHLQNLIQMVGELQVANKRLTREMSERTQAEKQLRLSEERFAKAFQSSPTAMSIQSLETYRYVDVNGSYLALTGFRREELIGRSSVDLNLWPDSAERNRLFDQLADGKAFRNVEMRIRAKGGQERTTLVSAEVLTLNGECFALISENDISHRLELEGQLRQSQKMEAIGQLAAGVAHDFNNLLTIIQGNVSMVLMQRELNPNIKRPLHETLAASERAGNLTRQLLAFSRKQVMQYKAIRLSHVFDHLGGLVQRLIGEQVHVVVNCPANVPAVYADACTLEQVIINLAVNARDAMPDGGQLTFSAERETVCREHVGEGCEPGEYICLSIKDTGCGMDDATQARIFEPFFTTKPVGKGTGLGLATVYGIIKQHKGWIDLESDVGRGTTFRIYLPVNVQGEESVVILKTDSDTSTCHGDETILVVEDEELVGHFVQTVLEANQYKVLLAANGPEALRVWKERSHEISLLLTDMIMPGGITGKEVARKFTSEKPDLRVIFSSGYTLADDHDFSGYSLLQKPYQAQVLASTVRRCLDGHSITYGLVTQPPALAA